MEGYSAARRIARALTAARVCSMSRYDASKAPALTAMFAYNLLVAAYLTYLGFGGELVGILFVARCDPTHFLEPAVCLRPLR